MADRDLQEHALDLAESLLEEIELSSGSVSQQVLKAVRLARIVGDKGASQWLRYELHGVPNSPEGREHMTRARRWTNRDEGKGFWIPVSDLEQSIATQRERLAASQVESFSGDYLIPVTREHRGSQSQISQEIYKFSRVVNAVKGLLHEFVSRTYYELAFSAKQRSLFDQARGEIDASLAPTSGRALEQVDSIYRRLAEGDREAISQAMTTCRRLIDEFADAVYPPRDEPILRDGQTIEVGPNRTQNRINEYFAERVPSSSRRKRVKRALSDIYDRVSTGVHKDVTADEARFLFLATYTLLGEMLAADRVAAPE